MVHFFNAYVYYPELLTFLVQRCEDDLYVGLLNKCQLLSLTFVHVDIIPFSFQILLGLPFLLFDPIAYISRAFNLGRVFIHFWCVSCLKLNNLIILWIYVGLKTIALFGLVFGKVISEELISVWRIAFS